MHMLQFLTETNVNYLVVMSELFTNIHYFIFSLNKFVIFSDDDGSMVPVFPDVDVTINPF